MIGRHSREIALGPTLVDVERAPRSRTAHGGLEEATPMSEAQAKLIQSMPGS
jgi:hypothetical protein